ncbi:flagellin [Virgibacillus sp. SK37]|uniref:flagellin N-terminal helical domain-containing protein n=1 Tax=Virgibacillus sp. SK37 TaxID=403957 RepID=UPI0004D0FBF1|nr:flagellin [Virgibacillus sp. SK37]AIF44535.1 flagellin [Virgibacillus sp. SK37]
MRINHNIAALNTYRQLNSASNAQSSSMEKLASGLRINKAGDDAAGLAISEKMRGQIRGLDMAAKNSQDGVSMLQTAEGALNETHDILQRMRELATQASNDTNTETDRNEIQKEINQLTSETNRIGNTTEFNTQSLLKGDGSVDLEKTGIVANAKDTGNSSLTQASAVITVGADANEGETVSLTIGGKNIEVAFTGADETAIDAAEVGNTGDGVIKSGTLLADKLTAAIEADETLKGQFTVNDEGDGSVTIAAVANGNFDGNKGSISEATGTGTITATAGVGTTSNTAATEDIDFTSAFGSKTGSDLTDAIKDLVGKGFEINGQEVEFYNQNDGTYKGEAVGVDISRVLEETTADNSETALADTIATQIGKKLDGVELTSDGAGTLTATTTVKGEEATLEIKDGTEKKDFTATFQVGANKGQSMTIEIGDMRADALGLTGKAGEDGFSDSLNVTNGTDNNSVEAALDVTSHESAAKAIETINNAIEQVSAERSKLGAYQNRLDHTINNLGTSSENLTAAESRIRDVDYALAA